MIYKSMRPLINHVRKFKIMHQKSQRKRRYQHDKSPLHLSAALKAWLKTQQTVAEGSKEIVETEKYQKLC